METSYFLAQLFGVYFVLMSVAIYLQPNMMKNVVKDLDKNKTLTLFIGIIIFVAGFSLVSIHNIWEMSWRGLITLFAWLTMLKGMSFILVPNWLIGLSYRLLNDSRFLKFAQIFMIIIGFYLIGVGFGFIS